MEYFCENDAKVILVRWNDNSVLHVGSNEHRVQPFEQVERYSASAKKIIKVPTPNIVSNFNASMGGVDRLDQMFQHIAP